VHADDESASGEETVIKIHHLNYSRSTRIIWLMEELSEPYEIVPHSRNPNTFRSPQTLEQVHPLGKAPVIEDGSLKLAESGAIIEYLISTYGRGKLAPPPGGASWARYIELLHFAEGSAMFPLLVHLLGMFTGGLSDGLRGFITPDIAKILKYLDAEVARNGYLMAEGFTGADIQMSYVVEIARMGKLHEPYASLGAWMARLEQRPAYKRAIERGGPVRLPI
jgi:glutathione S-transferase